MKDFLWNLYAIFYDTVTLNFTAYRDLLDILEKKANIQEGDKVLNAGCGTGNFEKHIKETQDVKGFTWVGIDVSPAMLKRAKNKLKDQRFQFKMEDLDEDLSFPDDEFDVVIAVHSIYPLKQIDRIFEEFYRILKNGGRLIIVNPKKGSQMSKMFKYEREKRGFIKLIFLIVRVLPGFIINIIITLAARKGKYKFLRKEEIKDIIKQRGFKIQQDFLVYADQSLLIISEK